MNAIKHAELNSEAIPQLALNLWVIKQFGVKDPIQIISAILSWIGALKHYSDRTSFIRNGEDLGIASWSFAKALVNLIIPSMTQFIALMLYLCEPCIPLWWTLWSFLFAHPTMGWLMANNFKIFHSKLKCSHKLVLDVGSLNIFGYCCILMVESIIIYYVFFVVSL